MNLMTCPVCDSSSYQVFSTKTLNRIVICQACHFYYVNPLPSWPGLRGQLEEASTYTDDQRNKLPRFRKRFEVIFERIEQHVPVGRVLDLGCAIGIGLSVAKERGWEGVGIEVSRQSVEIARSNHLDVRLGTLDDYQFPDSSFDLVVIHHVLEHITNLETFLSKIKRMISADGMLFIVVPNVYAWKFYFQKENYTWTFHDDHYSHFSTNTLSRLLSKHGFQIIEVSTKSWDFSRNGPDASHIVRFLSRCTEKIGMGKEIFCLAKPTF